MCVYVCMYTYVHVCVSLGLKEKILLFIDFVYQQFSYVCIFLH